MLTAKSNLRKDGCWQVRAPWQVFVSLEFISSPAGPTTIPNDSCEGISSLHHDSLGLEQRQCFDSTTCSFSHLPHVRTCSLLQCSPAKGKLELGDGVHERSQKEQASC